MERLEDCISFLIGKAGQQIARRAREKLFAYGVTPTQYAVLKVLWDEDGQSGVELGGRLVVDSATTTGIVDRLQASDLLERRPDAGDRRINRLFLTKKGRALQAPLEAAMDELNEEVARELGGKAKGLWTALRRLADQK